MSRGHHKVFYKCEHAMFFSKTELLNRPVSGLTSFRNWFSFGLDFKPVCENKPMTPHFNCVCIKKNNDPLHFCSSNRISHMIYKTAILAILQITSYALGV
jgi:hypothetical protein